MRPRSVDRAAVHAYLWKKADSRGRLRILQVKLADELGCTTFTLNRVLQELEQAGRIRRVSRKRAQSGLYEVFDPSMSDGVNT